MSKSHLCSENPQLATLKRSAACIISCNEDAHALSGQRKCMERHRVVHTKLQEDDKVSWQSERYLIDTMSACRYNFPSLQSQQHCRHNSSCCVLGEGSWHNRYMACYDTKTIIHPLPSEVDIKSDASLDSETCECYIYKYNMKTKC